MSILSDAAHKAPIAPPVKAPILKHAGKLVTATASTGAALVSIITFLVTHGVMGKADSRPAIGSLNVAWVGLRPLADTASAIGDTLHLAATVTDKAGTILVGAKPTWTSDDPKVAKVLPDGTVIATGAGTATVTLAVGDHIARSRIIVAQKVATIQVGAAAGERDVVLPEADRRTLRALALDARGNTVVRAAVQWRADDSTVVDIDSAGTVTGRMPGRAIVSASAGGVSGHAAVTVVAAPAAIAASSGAAQRAPAGTQLTQPVVVRVTSRRDRPVEGVLVTFRTADAQGRAEPASALTDADGRARTTWTLGDRPGRQTLLATVAQVDSALAVVAESDPVAWNTRLASAAVRVEGTAGARVETPVVVRLTDTTGRALPDVPIVWTTLDGGRVDSADVRTDSLGEARGVWTLGGRVGTQRLRVQAGSGRGSQALAPAIVFAEARAGAPATVAAASGDAQQVTAGALLAKPIVVRVADAAGNGVPDVPLALSPSSGAVSDSVVRTDSLGAARIVWRLGPSVGAHTLGVRVAGIAKPLVLTARTRPGAAANLTIEPDARKSSGAARRLVALVTDEYGNPVPDAHVRFATKSGTVTPARAVTDAKGRVTLTWTPRGTGEASLAGTVGTDVRGTYAISASEPATTVRQAGSTRAPAAKPAPKRTERKRS